MSLHRFSHALFPKKCFENAAWVGNLYSCPVCGQSIAVGAAGSLFVFPRFKRYKELLNNIPKQPEWYYPNDADTREALRQFMLKTFENADDFVIGADDAVEDEEIERNEEEE